jgi:lysophospholipase L1-like esterase
MATVTVTTIPVALDATGAAELGVTNTGSVDVYINAQRLRPGQRRSLSTATPLLAATAAGSGSVDTAVSVPSAIPTTSGVASAAVDVPGLFIPGGVTAWAANLRARLAAGQLGTIAVHGDSLSHGMYASSLRTKSWPGLLTAALQAKWGDGGSGFLGTANSTLVLNAVAVPAAAVTAYGGTNDLWTLTGTFTGSQGGGPGWQVVRTAVAGDTATTPTGAVRGRYIDVLTHASSGGPYTVTAAVDGGTPQTITAAAASPALVTTIDTGSAAGDSHTVVITNGAASTVDICGVRGRNTTGVVVDKYALYGQRTAMFNNTDGGRSGAWSGGALGPGTPAQLLIYSLFANDAAQATATETSMQNIVADLNGFQSSVYGGTSLGAVDVLFVLPHMGRFDATAPMRGALKSRITSLCRSEGYAYVDLHALGRNSWDWMNAQGYFGNSGAIGTVGTDNIHLSDAGFAWVAQQVQRPLQVAGLL